MPSSIEQLMQLSTIDMHNNSIWGYVPASLGTLDELVKLDLGENNFQGPVPNTLGNLAQLEVLILNHNKLTGTLPDSIGNLKHLQVLDFYVNKLHGWIPDTYAQLQSMKYLDLYENELSGTVPAFLGNLTSFVYLYLGENKFTGSIPNSLGQLPNLVSLYVNQNFMTGTVPVTLSNLKNLIYLFLQDNNFRGTLSGVFNSTIQRNLSIVLFSQNEITGSLPSELFRITSLTVVDGGSNCMAGGTLPDTLCQASNLQTLSLDGIHASSACRTLLLPGLADTYKLEDPIAGGVPSCVYELPHLVTLHLSGNGLTGTIPSDVILSQSFIDFAMSHNFIEGHMPQRFQQRKWRNLDVSFNRIMGTLYGDFAPQTLNTSLSLRNNRLSGSLPQAVIDAHDVEVLDGNLFYCNPEQTDLPKNDRGATTYECGSNTFNLSYYFWLSASAMLFACGLIYALRLKGGEVNVSTALYDAFQQVRAFLNVFDLKGEDGTSFKAKLRRYKKICDICKLIMRLSFLLATFVVLVLMPFYAIMGVFYSTHSHKYAYTVSIIFLSGVVPGGLAMTLLSLFVIFAFVCFVVFLRAFQRECVLFEAAISLDVSAEDQDLSYRESLTVAVESVLTWEKVSIYVGCVLIDVMVVLGANVGFVYIVLNGNKTALTAAQVALSLFKIFWDAVCSWTAYYLSVIMQFESKNIRRGIFSMLFIITLFNNIVAPCLVVMAISATCFYNIFEPSEEVTSSYSYQECLAYDQTGCYEYTDIVTVSSFEPPFIYSYQCAASFLTAYAPSFVYVCIVSGFITPAVHWACRNALHRTKKKTSLWYKLLHTFTPMILKPISTSKGIPRKLFSPFFDSRKLLVTLLNYLGILMTFGAVFPPLAVAMCITIISHVFFSRLEVKRFLEEAALKNTEYINVIDEDCYGVGSDSMLLRAMWVLVTMSFCFYTFFLFDTLGDAVGYEKALWVLVVMPLLPLALYLMFKAYTGTFFLRTRVRLFSTTSTSTSTSHMHNVEMLARIQAEAREREEEEAAVTSPMPHVEC